jgi:hypothetical protein
MDLMAVAWSSEFIAASYGAVMLCGMLICASERRAGRRDPSDDDVAHAANCYRLWFGDEASQVIGEHMFAATFSRDGRHRRFLKEVASRLEPIHLQCGAARTLDGGSRPGHGKEKDSP